METDLKDVVPFFDWLPTALLAWVAVLGCIAIFLLAIGWLLAAIRHNPIRGTQIIAKVLRNAVVDLVGMSPRRVWALARLVIKESIRRRIVVVFAVFIVILLFAGWYLDQESIDPARLYLNFVLTATTYLVLLLALFLSSQSLPTDIKNHTLYTVVTKPVRASEVVLGRVVGFTIITTVLLAVMGSISYVFVVRGLAHTHELTADDLHGTGKSGELRGLTSDVKHHRHHVIVKTTRSGHSEVVEPEQRHTHALTITGGGSATTYTLGPAEGMLQARVPLFGTVQFFDRTGMPVAKGVNVGDEYQRRSYVEGASHAAIVWTFEGITPERFPDGLPVEMNIEVFRTWKANIEKRVLGSLSVRNPKTDIRAAQHDNPVKVSVFESREHEIDSHRIRPQFEVAGKKYDLFKDFVHGGKVEIWLKCEDHQQYFGAAWDDLYLHAADNWFVWNFAKGYVGIWLQAVIIIALGVTFSTFLSGPVAMIATLGALIGGLFNEFMTKLANQQTYGGGPFESLYRMITQQNVTSLLPPGLQATVVQTLDQPSRLVLHLASRILPDFSRFSFSDKVAFGVNIPDATLLMYVCRMFAFVIPVFIVGYLCLRNREVAGRN
jgi:ABC-type transport system involved in multi-copper enzyme maturation permease subunit